MGNKRLIITSTISIVLVAILLIGSTYSIFTSTEIDEKENVYTTGVLDITYTLSEDNVIMEDATPTSIEDSIEIKPYRITVTNNGNVAYKFNVILNDTTASNKINSQYLMTQVGKLTPTLLSDCTNNILKSDIIVLPNTSVDIDIRVWLYTNVQNSEMGKSFYGKLAIDGLAVNTDETEVDNSDLIAELPKQLLSTASPGSYVAYVGNNGCDGVSCSGANARYYYYKFNDDNEGACENVNGQKYNNYGWRVAYISNNSATLISAGAVECFCTNSDGTSLSSRVGESCDNSASYSALESHVVNLNNTALKYCNSNYAYNGVCDASSAWNINDNDFYIIYGKTVGTVKASEESLSNNELIYVGSSYWLSSAPSSSAAVGIDLNTVSGAYSKKNFGIRPVLKLSPTVYITGGTGTQENPYTIANN